MILLFQFARYMETLDGGESAREVYKRACYTHLPKKPNPHLAWSAYEERLGNVTEALRILKDFERDVPGLVQIQLRRIGLMRRQAALNTAVDKGEKVSPAAGSTSASVSYSDVAHTYESIIRDSTYSPRALAFYAIKYARFVAKVSFLYEPIELAFHNGSISEGKSSIFVPEIYE